jgi:hypothetical protein
MDRRASAKEKDKLGRNRIIILQYVLNMYTHFMKQCNQEDATCFGFLGIKSYSRR